MINYAVDVFLIILIFSIFGYIHSLTASFEIKKKLFELVGDKIAFYRLGFNILSLFLLYLAYLIMPKPNLIIYDLNPPYDLLVLIPQFAGLAGIFWTFRYICLKEFIGIQQIERWLKRNYNSEELDEHYTLRINGPYTFVRHPLYFFSMMILIFQPIMDLFYLTILIYIIAYFYIGSEYEEKKLIKIFNDDYIKYRETIPRLIPLKPFQPYKS